ncbi:MAG: type II toxin-antitoxin system RelE/ParE family toxin [Acidobacteriota bacterium]|nr:type II toxin-antitoxin system RelE/ParE family toxin [Acidobacteriota bacterium]
MQDDGWALIRRSILLPLRLSESAVSDLEDLVLYFEGKGTPEVGPRLVEQILAKIEILSQFPDLGRVVPEFEREDLRELIFRSYRIIYRREEMVVRIVRVWRSERLLRLS